MAANTNVMSVAPQPGNGPRAAGDGGRQSVRTAGRERPSSNKEGRFGEVLEKTQDSEKFRQNVTDQADEAADMPKDPIAAVIAASSQTKQSGQPKAEPAAETEEAAEPIEDVQKTADTAARELLMPNQASEAMAETFLSASGTEAVFSAKLQTLLPQSEEDGQKGRSMLHMLSGQGWRQAKTQVPQEAVWNTAAEVPAESADAQKVQDARTVQDMRTVQDVQGVSEQVRTQPATLEQSQQQQAIQQERPQAQPGMQGMPVMRDAQASLTQTMQNVPNPQESDVPKGQAPVMETAPNTLDQKAETDSAFQGQPLNQRVSEDRGILGRSVPQPTEMVSGERAQGRENLISQMRTEEQPSRTEEQPLRAEERPFQQSANQSRQTAADPVRPLDARDFIVPQTEQRQGMPQRENFVSLSEGRADQAPMAASVAAEPRQAGQRSREDISNLLGTQVTTESSAKTPAESLRQMMHGQEQPGQQQQPPPERQPRPEPEQGVRPMTDDTVENRNPAQANMTQHASETVPHQHQGANFQQVMNTAQTQAPEPTQAPMAPRQDFNIPGQIVEQARLIRNTENTEMVIRLRPEHLGDLTLKVSVSENGAVTASFHSDNAQVRAIIENSLVQLRQELSNQGIKVDNVEVYAGLSGDSLLNGQGQQAWQQGQQGNNSSRSRNFDLESYEEEGVEFSQAAEGLTAEEGVDYRV